MKKARRRKVYYPPKTEDIEEAASLLRERLGRDSDFEDGFGSLLKAIAKAYAHNLSREAEEEFDNGQQTA